MRRPWQARCDADEHQLLRTLWKQYAEPVHDRGTIRQADRQDLIQAEVVEYLRQQLGQLGEAELGAHLRVTTLARQLDDQDRPQVEQTGNLCTKRPSVLERAADEHHGRQVPRFGTGETKVAGTPGPEMKLGVGAEEVAALAVRELVLHRSTSRIRMLVIKRVTVVQVKKRCRHLH